MTQIQEAIQQGLAALRAPELNIQKLATYTSMGIPSYSPTTGTIMTPNTVYASVPMVFTNYARRDIDGEAIRADDQKATIATNDLTPIPTLNDKITKADGSVWSVLSVGTDPADAAWVLQVRRP